MYLSIELFAVLFVTLLGGIASLWFRIGKLTGEVKGHNQRLDMIQSELKSLRIDDRGSGK